jgi:hypothetical protein
MNSMRSKLYVLFSVCTFLIAVNSVFGRTLTTHFLYTANTGNNATVGIPTSINPLINGTAIAVGDEIGVFTPGGLCVGAEVWTGSNLAITVWGDNDQTPVVDGIGAGEQMQFRMWRQSSNKEYPAQVTYTLGTSTYAANGIYQLGSLVGAPPQPYAQGGIYASGNTFTVKFRPTADITGGFTGGNFGIRWLTSLGASVNLSGETGSFGYVNQGAKTTSGAYTYIVYASTNAIASTTYTAGTEYTLMTVTVSGGRGTGSFELCPSGFASDAGQWYIELGGADRANTNKDLWYYQSSATASMTLNVKV